MVKTMLSRSREKGLRFKIEFFNGNYLGRYIHRVAISNSRIVDFDGTTVLPLDRRITGITIKLSS